MDRLAILAQDYQAELRDALGPDAPVFERGLRLLAEPR